MIHVPVPELSSVWPQVRKHLASAVDKFGERVTPEELYYLLRQGNASLYLDDKGTVTLFVLLTAGKLAEVWEDCVALLEKLAETIGAVRIRMASPSRGWERAMNGYWSVAHVVYEHDLRNGNVQVAA